MQKNKTLPEIKIGQKTISINHPTYFIADIGANHDGDIERAKALVYLAKEAGADVAKFQHFHADKIVSDYGFKNLGNQKSHQATWDKSVYEIYKHYETNRKWTEELVATCRDAEIEFMTTPYDFEAIEDFSKILPAFKIGSGDITWIQAIEKVASYQMPVLLATGAADIEDVERAVSAITQVNPSIVLMQCNTNYTASVENFKYINLNVLKTYAKKWPGVILGLSDHTLGHTTVLGAITLGARVIEKHFTDDNSRVGPDHKFAMNPTTWRAMVNASKELEFALGDGIKRIEANEQDTSIIQQRSVRLKSNKNAGEKIQYEDLEFLRPAPEDALKPYQYELALNKTLKKSVEAGDMIRLEDLE